MSQKLEKINLYLFIFLIILNFLDLILTWYGIIHLKSFTESNPFFKNDIEQGNIRGAVLIKTIFLLMVSFGIWFKKGQQHRVYSQIIMVLIGFALAYYLYAVAKWLVFFWIWL